MAKYNLGSGIDGCSARVAEAGAVRAKVSALGKYRMLIRRLL